MKIIKPTPILLLLVSLSLFAYDSDIDRQIAAMQNASPSQRVAMMNRLKQSIVKMNATDRQLAINKLRGSSSSSSFMQQQTPSSMAQRVQMQQMNQQMNSQQIQIINQKESVTTIIKNTITPEIPTIGN